MRIRRAQSACLLLLHTLLAGAAVEAHGQAIVVGKTKAQPNISVGKLTFTVTPASVSIPLKSKGIATASAPIVINTSYPALSLLSSYSVYGYFSDPTAALKAATGTAKIPTSCVFGQVTTGTPTTYTAFTQTNANAGGAGTSLLLFKQSSVLSVAGSRTDNLSLQINLTSIPQLPAGSYTGVLTLQVQTF